MSSKINNASLTKYPKIFGGTYWNRNVFGGDPEIIKNRNLFVEEYNIKRKVNISYKRPLGKKRFESEINPEYPGNSTFDHFELYERKGDLGYVAIFSRYCDLNPMIKGHQQPIDMGYRKYRRLYNTGSEDMSCPTYILAIPR